MSSSAHQAGSRTPKPVQPPAQQDQLPTPRTSPTPPAPRTSRTHNALPVTRPTISSAARIAPVSVPAKNLPSSILTSRTTISSSARVAPVSALVERATPSSVAKRSSISSMARRAIFSSATKSTSVAAPVERAPILPVTHTPAQKQPLEQAYTAPENEDERMQSNPDAPTEPVDTSTEEPTTVESAKQAAKIIGQANGTTTTTTARARGFVAFGGGNISVSGCDVTVVSDRSAMLAGADGPDTNIKLKNNVMRARVVGNDNGNAYGLVGIGGGTVESHNCKTFIESSGFSASGFVDRDGKLTVQDGTWETKAMREL